MDRECHFSQSLQGVTVSLWHRTRIWKKLKRKKEPSNLFFQSIIWRINSIGGRLSILRTPIRLDWISLGLSHLTKEFLSQTSHLVSENTRKLWAITCNLCQVWLNSSIYWSTHNAAIKVEKHFSIKGLVQQKLQPTLWKMSCINEWIKTLKSEFDEKFTNYIQCCVLLSILDAYSTCVVHPPKINV